MFEVDKGIQPYWFIGQVVDNNDFANANRVKVRCLGVHPDAPGLDPNPNDKTEKDTVYDEDLPWAHLINGTYGKLEMIPDINDWVFGFFADGRECQHPYVLGLLSGMGTDVTGLTPECGPGSPAGTGPAAQGPLGSKGVEDPTLPQCKGMTPEKAAAIRETAERLGVNPNALAGILSIESGLNPSTQGGASNRFYGIFQLEDRQIPGLTKTALGTSYSPSQYLNLSFNDQLKVYEQYVRQAPGVGPGFFTGDGAQDASRLWAIQLAPSNAAKYDYSNPNTVISPTAQAARISAGPKRVTVGSVQNATLSCGGLGDPVTGTGTTGGGVI